jgi:hypothetical protein
MANILSNQIFGGDQNQALNEGAQKRAVVDAFIRRTILGSDNSVYPHAFISGRPGIGKTHVIKQILNMYGSKYISISGYNSMFAFGVKLALINHQNKNKEKIIIFIDDCDSFFSDEDSCNTLKNILDGARKFTYEKSLNSQLSKLEETQQEAVLAHQVESGIGFEVDCSNMTFIFASNFNLPDDDAVATAQSRNQRKAVLMMHKNAIRSRCRVLDINLNNRELWGWISDVTLNTSLLKQYKLTKEQKVIILDFIWDNWNSLSERSIRLVDKMAATLKSCPDDFESYWLIEHLKS